MIRMNYQMVRSEMQHNAVNGSNPIKFIVKGRHNFGNIIKGSQQYKG